MKVGFIGTGKLGLPVSFVYASRGHELLCYDTNPIFYEKDVDIVNLLYEEERDPFNKDSLREWVKTQNINLKFVGLETIMRDSDIVFLAVQTPHNPKYEGSTRIPDDRVDFDYSYLINAAKQVSRYCVHDIPVIIISTVLPGTIRREIMPLLSPFVKLCYNPYFIAMGTVANDCLHPEFILLGNHDKEASDKVTAFYKTICDAPVFSTNIENAEMIKVTYNTFITTKTVLGNTIMDLCSKLPGTDCDEVLRGITLATRRIISPAYLKGGMGDGGGCHPRDNIALSWLSRSVGLQYDYYDMIMKTREKQCESIIEKIIEVHKQNPDLPIWLYGKSFKPNTSIITGSAAVLLGNILQERNIPYTFHDPHTENTSLPSDPCIICITCAHDIFKTYTFPKNSIVIDPHRSYSQCDEYGKYIPIGKS